MTMLVLSSAGDTEWARRYQETLIAYGGMSPRDARETFKDWFLENTDSNWWEDDPVQVAVEEVRCGLVGVDKSRMLDGRAQAALARLKKSTPRWCSQLAEATFSLLQRGQLSLI